MASGDPSLFDAVDRRDMDAKTQSESNFEYLNRTARPMFASVRGVLDEWWRRTPRAEQPRLRRSLRSRLDPEFLSAFWELYLHAALRQSGCRVRMHAFRRATGTAPDFKAMTPDGNFYIEATTFGVSHDQVAAGRRRAQAFDRLDALGDARFMIDLDIEYESGEQLDLGSLAATTRSWLETLDPAQVVAGYVHAGWQSLPTLTVRERGWVIVMRAIPISPSKVGAVNRSIGTYVEGGVVSVHAPGVIRRLQSKIRKKALRYGRLRLPFVVAVIEDRDYPATDQVGMELALYKGMPLSGGESISALFGTESHPKLTRVSAVIVARRLVPWTVGVYEPVVWHHPYARRALESPFPWPQARFLTTDGALEITPSNASPTDVFGLGHPWPSPDEPP